MTVRKNITLADLRREAPKGWEIEEGFVQAPMLRLWRLYGIRKFPNVALGEEFIFWSPSRQTARRMALAALKALKESR